MSWETFTPPPPHSTKADLRIGVRVAPRGGRRIATFRISAKVATELGLPAHDMRVSLGIGTEQNAGKARLIRAERATGGGIAVQPGKKNKHGARQGFTFTVLGIPGAEPCKLVSVPYEVKGDTIIFAPPWLK